ncbi:MAG: NAD-dependent epimerase/dehydratase family protein [Chloroflexota bacterium]
MTGATGLLGGWLVRQLIELGAHVVILVRDWVPRSVVLSEPELASVVRVHGDVRDSSIVARVLGEYEIDTVFHLAAQTIVGTANNHPAETLDVNVRGTWVMLDACRQLGTVKAMILASSDKAYGDQLVLPYAEDAPLSGQHPYDVSKSCADLIAHAFAVSYGLPVAITRCGNLFGGGDHNFNRLVPGTIRSGLKGERPIIRSDGSYIRDYFYVRDAARAYVTLAEHVRQGKFSGEAFNFSSEERLSVLEMAGLILSLMGRSDLAPIVEGTARNEIVHQYLSAEKARLQLGWQPRYGLKDGLVQTIDWYRSHVEHEIR